MITIQTKKSNMETFKKIFLAVLVLYILAVLTSCENNHVEEALPEGAINPCDTAVAKFNTEIIPIFNAKCATSGCHDGSNDPDMTTNIFANLETSITTGTFKTKVLDERSMPQLGSPELTNNEFLKIKCWFENGHLNN